MIEDIAIQSITFIAFITFAAKRLMNYLHALQEDDYNNGRLMGWIVRNRVFDSRVSQFLIILTGTAFLVEIPSSVLNVIVFLAFVMAAYFEKDPRKNSKKALVMTKRAKRIFTMGLTFTLLSSIVAFYISTPAIWIAIIQLVPIMLIFGNASLAPYEGSVQKKFYIEAQQKLEDLNPTIIGITGSYGKTSVKHILGHILKTTAPTLA